MSQLRLRIRGASPGAQAILEYVLVIGIVVLALTAMQPLVKRGIQSIVKVTSDQLAVQNQADQTVEPDKGYLIEAFTSRRASTDKLLEEGIPGPGVTNKSYKYGDKIVTEASSVSSGGFTNQSD